MHDKRSLIVAYCIAGAMLLASWGFVVWGLTMATEGLWR